MSEQVVAYIDGGSRGNPGPAGYGVRIETADGELLDEFFESIGHATNNVAEYRGLIAALDYLKDNSHLDVVIRFSAFDSSDDRTLSSAPSEIENTVSTCQDNCLEPPQCEI